MAQVRLELNAGPLLVEDDGLLVKARGVPYATAERFAAPIPATPHNEVRDATQRGPICPQLPSRLDSVNGPITDGLPSSEQCLVLSVVAPKDARPLPVMVWFHGGAYMSGSGEAPKYDPDALAREGRVVVVTVSYRLGIFGYLAPERDGESNLGLKDQILALRWVQDNIAAFGGDPAQTTIFGQSAGGDSVFSLILCPETRGLFRRAILQSAPLGLRGGRAKMTAAMRDAATVALGDSTAQEASVEELLTAQAAGVAAAQRFGLLGGFPFAPIAGADPMPATSDERYILAQRATEVDLLVGYTRTDAAPFAAMDSRAQRLQRFGALGKAAFRLLSIALTQRIFGAPARRLAKTWTSSGGAAATFRVDWSPPGAPLGPCHCIDLPLLFGSSQLWADAPMLGGGRNPVDAEVARSARAQWAAFAHGGPSALGNSTLRI